MVTQRRDIVFDFDIRALLTWSHYRLQNRIDSLSKSSTVYNILKTCPSASKVLLQCEFLDLVCELVSQFKKMAQRVETMELSISMCAIMCELEGEECMRGLRRSGLLGKLWEICQEITERLLPEFPERLSEEGATRQVSCKN